MVYLRCEQFPIGRYHKLKYKRIGAYKIIKKINDNAYEVSLQENLETSHIFYVSNLYTFHWDVLSEDDIQGVDWQHHLLNNKKENISQILDKKTISKRHGHHNIYLIQWDGLPETESTWLSEWAVMQLDPIKLQQFIGSHLQELCFFEEGKNDVSTSRSHNFWLGYGFLLKIYRYSHEEELFGLSMSSSQ